MPNPQHQTNPKPHQSTVGNSPIPSDNPPSQFANFNPAKAVNPRMKGNPNLRIAQTSTSAPMPRKVYP